MQINLCGEPLAAFCADRRYEQTEKYKNMRLFKKKKIYNATELQNIKLKCKVGLALSGGGTRGFAHIGVIKAFNEERIGFNFVAGTSVGSLIGAMYCAGVGTDAMMEEARLVSRKEIVRRLWLNSDPSNIEQIADRLLVNRSFDELSVPFAAVAVNIGNGSEEVLSSGSVAKAVSASCAVPVLFRPVSVDGKLLVDGGLLNNMPADVCRNMGAEIVIGVDLDHNRGSGARSQKLKDILVATWTITTKSTMYKGKQNSDLVIEPELSKFSRASLDDIDAMVAEGYRAAKQRMPEIKKLLGIK